MSTTRPHTKDYSQQDRDRLARDVQRAREAVWKFRPKFAEHAGIGVTSLVKLETGKPVGPYVYETVARALPNWTEDTPVAILGGADAPAVAKPATGQARAVTPRPAEEPPPYEWSAEARQKLIAMSMQEVLQLVESERLLRGDVAAERAWRAIDRLRAEAAAVRSEAEAP